MSFYLGVDAGSVSLKLVIWDGKEIIWQSYRRISGRLMSSFVEAIQEAKEGLGDLFLSGVVVVGSGRRLIGNQLQLITSDEITAQVAAARELQPEVKTIIEIGGQDAKAIVIQPDGSVTFLMNDLCAAGTGAFLDQQAARLGIQVEELSKLASMSRSPVNIASRCAVFAKSDMTHHQQSGRSIPDILAGLHIALVKGYLANVSRGLPIKPPICFHGGVASNEDLVRRFEQVLKQKISVPKCHKIAGAMGAAILASRTRVETSFSGLLSKVGGDDCSDENTLPALRKQWCEAPVTWQDLPGLFLGIDIGSVSVKLVALENGRPVYSNYQYSNGDPRKTLTIVLAEAERELKRRPDGVGVTGSGRAFGAWMVGADVSPNEISAQDRACGLICPDAEVIVEIGGQDAKFLRRKDGVLYEFKMNRSCAAGTGAFLTEQCPRLGLKDEAELAKHAFDAKRAPVLGSRCTVFMECELVSCQQKGWSRTELAAALSRSVVRNYLEKVAASEVSGKKILFLGGVAENKAVVAALCEEVGGQVYVSSWGKFSAAIGAALIVSDSYKSGRYSKTTFSWQMVRQVSETRCDGCANLCSVWQLPGNRIFGGRCGKHDQAVSRKRPDLLDHRMRLLEEPSQNQDQAVAIGIPPALMYYDRFALWKTFLGELGAKIIMSPKGNFLEIPPMPADTCLPLKALLIECRQLDDMNCDYLFVPAMVIDAGGIHHCPIVQCAPLFASFNIKTPVLNPAFNWECDPESERKALVKIAGQLGKSRVAARQAYGRAVAAQKQFKEAVFAIGTEALSGIDGNAFVLLGKDYNIYDPRLNSGVAAILASYLPVLGQDMLASASPSVDPDYGELRWHHGLEMIRVAKEIRDRPNMLPVVITSFGCGPDSFTLRYVREVLRNRPLLVLEVDEHTSEVGLATRVEAFLDSIKRQRRIATGAPPAVVRKKWKRVFIPNFGAHALGIASAVKAVNLEPVMMPPSDEESYALAKRYLEGNECHPFALLLGDLLKAGRHAKPGDCFFMSPNSTACRLGHFGRHMRMIIRDMGIPVDITDNIDELAAHTGGSAAKVYRQLLTRAWPVMRGCDLLYQRFYETRRRAADKCSVDLAFDRAVGFIKNAVINETNVVEAFRRACQEFEIPVATIEPRVRIGITGDYFTRISAFGNQGILFSMNEMGAEIMLSPTFSDVSAFDAHTMTSAAVKHWDFTRAGIGLYLRAILPRMDRDLRAAVPCLYPVPLHYRAVREELARYIPIPMHNAMVGTLAAVLEQVRAGADGVVNIITFNCTYGAIIAAFLRRLSRERNIPSINLIYEGLKPTHNLTRLEAFLNTLTQKKANRQSVSF